MIDYLCPNCDNIMKFKGYTSNNVYKIYKCPTCKHEYFHYYPTDGDSEGGWYDTTEGWDCLFPSDYPKIFDGKVIFT